MPRAKPTSILLNDRVVLLQVPIPLKSSLAGRGIEIFNLACRRSKRSPSSENPG